MYENEYVVWDSIDTRESEKEYGLNLKRLCSNLLTLLYGKSL